MKTLRIGRRRIKYRAADLWSQADIARTEWPVVVEPARRGRRAIQMECMQRPVVEFTAGDRLKRTQLVLTTKWKVIPRHERYFVRADPWGGA